MKRKRNLDVLSSQMKNYRKLLSSWKERIEKTINESIFPLEFNYDPTQESEKYNENEILTKIPNFENEEISDVFDFPPKKKKKYEISSISDSELLDFVERLKERNFSEIFDFFYGNDYDDYEIKKKYLIEKLSNMGKSDSRNEKKVNQNSVFESINFLEDISLATEYEKKLKFLQNIDDKEIIEKNKKRIKENEEQEKSECPICWECINENEKNDPKYEIVRCKHCFHLKCIHKAFSARSIEKSCPKCSLTVPNSELNLINNLVLTLKKNK